MEHMKRCKNPNEYSLKEAQKILSRSDEYEYLTEGSEASIFYFITYKGFDNLPPGEYILKIFHQAYFHNNIIIKYYENLSNLKLISKIYYHDPHKIIYKYVPGFKLTNIKLNSHKLEMDYFEIFEKIQKLIKKWHFYGFAHGDLNSDNIIIYKDKIFFIDPVYLPDGKKYFKYDNERINQHITYFMR